MVGAAFPGAVTPVVVSGGLPAQDVSPGDGGLVHAGLVNGGPTDGGIVVPDAGALFNGTFEHAGPDLLISHGDAPPLLIPNYFSSDHLPDLYSPEGAVLTGDTVSALAGSRAPGQYAQAGQPAVATAIGSVETISGTATAQRSDGTVVQLAVGDPVYQGDVVQTGGGSALSITFVDETVFSLSAGARMILDELVYMEGGTNNSMVMNLVQGTFVFVTGQVAPTGDMRVETPVATMGIRGTTPVVQVSAVDGATRFSLSPDPDGHVGSYRLFDRVTGQFIGNVSNIDQILSILAVGTTPLQETKTQADIDAERIESERAFDAYRQSQIDTRSGPDQNNGGQNGTGDPDQTDSGSLPGSGINTTPLGEPGSPLDPLSGSGGGGGSGLLDNGDGLPGGPPPGGSGGSENQNQDQFFDAPASINLPGFTVVTNEDQSIIISGLSIDDPNDGLVSVTMTAFSTVTLAQMAGLTFQTGDGTNDETMTFFGSESAVNAALNGFTYKPTPDSETGGLTITVYNGFQAASTSLPITITPQPDAPTATSYSLSVGEDGSVNGLFLGADPDTGDTLTLNSLTAPAKGLLTDNEDGSFTFATNGAFNSLAGGQSENVSFQFTVIDSTGLVSAVPGTVTIKVNGANDAATITGTTTGTVFEDGVLTVTGALAVSDPDTGQSLTQVQTGIATQYGSFTITDAGVWSYVLDNENAAVQALGVEETLSDSFTVKSLDGTASRLVTITIEGEDEGRTGDVFLQGNFLELGVAATGSLGSAGDAPAGFHSTRGGPISFLVDLDGWSDGGSGSPPRSGDVTLPGTPVDGYVVGYRDAEVKYSFVGAERSGLNELSATTVDTSARDQLSVTTAGVANGVLQMTQVISLNASDTYFATEITYTNLGETTLNDVRYMRTFDPDQDIDLFPLVEVFDTYNDVLSNPDGLNNVAIAQAVGPLSGISVNLVAFDPDARASNFGFANTDPFASEAFDTPVDLDGAFVDEAISLTFDFGSLAPGESVTKVFYTSMNGRAAGNDMAIGTGGADVIDAGLGDDFILGLEGADTLTGGGGADTFVLANFDATDLITDFNVTDDLLDLQALLDASFSDANQADYISAIADGENTIISIDFDGTGVGSSFVEVATLQGVGLGETINIIIDDAGTDASVMVA